MDGAALVAFGDDLEEQIGAELIDGEIFDFIGQDVDVDQGVQKLESGTTITRSAE